MLGKTFNCCGSFPSCLVNYDYENRKIQKSKKRIAIAFLWLRFCELITKDFDEVAFVMANFIKNSAVS